MQRPVRIGVTQVSERRHRPENPYFPTFCVPRHAVESAVRGRKCALAKGKNLETGRKRLPCAVSYMFLATASFESPLAGKPLPLMFQSRLNECAIRGSMQSCMFMAVRLIWRLYQGVIHCDPIGRYWSHPFDAECLGYGMLKAFFILPICRTSTMIWRTAQSIKLPDPYLKQFSHLHSFFFRLVTRWQYSIVLVANAQKLPEQFAAFLWWSQSVNVSDASVAAWMQGPTFHQAISRCWTAARCVQSRITSLAHTGTEIWHFRSRMITPDCLAGGGRGCHKWNARKKC